MSDDPQNPNIANALSRARSLAFTVFSASLLIGFVAFTSYADRQSELSTVESELNALIDIANRSDNATREIRRYVFIRLAEIESEKAAIRRITEAAAIARRDIERTSKKLVDARDAVPFEQILEINRLLKPLRTTVHAAASVNVDFSPQSVIVLDRLELYRLRDIAILAHLIRTDPVAIEAALKTFLTPSENDITIAAEQLLDDLKDVRDEGLEHAFAMIQAEGESLRNAVEQFSRMHGVLAIGGLSSSYQETLEHTRALERRRRELVASQKDGFDIDVPWVGLTMPAHLAVGLVPLGLFIGFGLIAGSLDYTCRKLSGISDKNKMATAADLGMLFDQLHKGTLFSWLLSWSLLLGLLLIPLIVTLIVVVQYTSALSGLWRLAVGIPLLLAFWPGIKIVVHAKDISDHAADKS
jgi:hypothetical protein